MSNIKSYKDLRIWQNGMDIAVEIYGLTRAYFPKGELFGLTSQVRRAANSITLNIAEGHSRHTTKAYVNFLVNALGSNNEVESALELALRLKFISPNDAEPLFQMLFEERKMITVLVKKLNTKSSTP